MKNGCNKLRILFVLPYLGGGGAERVVLTLLTHLDRNKFELSLALFDKHHKGGNYIELIPEDVQVFDLQSRQARYAIWKVARLIRNQRPDIVFTSLSHVNLLLGLIRPLLPKSIRFIARESAMASKNVREEKHSTVSQWLYRNVYNHFDSIVAQCHEMKTDLIEQHRCQPEKITVIQNPVDVEKIDHMASEPVSESLRFPQDKINLLSVGRLSHQKGYDLLLPAMKNLDERFFLTILGEGEEKKACIQLAEKLGVDHRVKFAGFASNPYHLMNKADVLVLSSRYEGMPNVILEANTCGTPVVAFHAPGVGPEVVVDGVTGFLVEDFDPRLLASTIEKACDHDFDPTAIRQHILDHFHVEKVMQKYESLLCQIT